jgi:hypothetical protein
LVVENVGFGYRIIIQGVQKIWNIHIGMKIAHRRVVVKVRNSHSSSTFTIATIQKASFW